MNLRLLIPALFAATLLGACSYPSQARDAQASRAFEDHATTYLGRSVLEEAAQHPGESGLYVLHTGLDAFAARIGMIDRAERALDVQYYIFHDDVTGRWMMSRLLAAADRGVRVRLLLDDIGAGGIDDLIASVDLHPNIEVRLFNPFARGYLFDGLAAALDGLTRPRRLNRRMHNKLMLGDGAASIVGGRNVGDEYFDAAEHVNFADLDMLAFGPVNQELGRSFDRYWNSPFVAPLESWSSFDRDAAELDELRAELQAWEQQHSQSSYGERLAQTSLVQEAADGTARLTWALTHAESDLPEKIVARGDDLPPTLLLERLKPYWPDSNEDLIIVSPYFVPRDKGVEHLCALVARGVRVRVLTNSLAATDVAAVHSGYKSYRHALLKGGVELYEMRPSNSALKQAHDKGMLGSSAASLHAKTFISDGRRLFVGSLNIDPRSVELNTELGLVIESRELVAQVAGPILEAMRPEMSWRVTLEQGELVWRGTRDGHPVVLDEEPDSSWWDRLQVDMLGLLPIKGQL